MARLLSSPPPTPFPPPPNQSQKKCQTNFFPLGFPFSPLPPRFQRRAGSSLFPFSPATFVQDREQSGDSLSFLLLLFPPPLPLLLADGFQLHGPGFGAPPYGVSISHLPLFSFLPPFRSAALLSSLFFFFSCPARSEDPVCFPLQKKLFSFKALPFSRRMDRKGFFLPTPFHPWSPFPPPPLPPEKNGFFAGILSFPSSPSPTSGRDRKMSQSILLFRFPFAVLFLSPKEGEKARPETEAPHFSLSFPTALFPSNSPPLIGEKNRIFYPFFFFPFPREM